MAQKSPTTWTERLRIVGEPEDDAVYEGLKETADEILAHHRYLKKLIKEIWPPQGGVPSEVEDSVIVMIEVSSQKYMAARTEQCRHAVFASGRANDPDVKYVGWRDNDDVGNTDDPL